MDSPIHIVTAGAISIFIIYYVWKLLQIGRRRKDYPPGPPTIPILGNIHQIPKEDVHLQFQKWAQEYGPVYSLMLGSKTMIVLSSDQAIKDLLDRRSAIYSDRMDLYMGQTLLSGGFRILMMRYGATWRIIRRIVHNLLNIHAARSFEPYQILENKQMIHDILKDPENFKQHLRRYANSLTTATTFGFRTPTYEDTHLQSLFTIFGEFAILAQTGTAALLDYLPALRIVPSWLLPPKRRAKALHIREKALYRYHWDNVKAIIKSAAVRANPCFSVGLAREQDKHGFSDDLASYITGTLLEAGSDTTSNTLLGFVCAMLVFPSVQKRAQEELDRVIGVERMPTTEDAESLPYIRGCVKESLRWMPTTILGAVPHALMRDDEYMGYRLPKGAGVLNNVYAIHNDPVRYPNPRRFNPERFKDDTQSAFDAALNPDVSKRDHFTFGAGRRICPGMHVAERSLFLGIARMLWAFDFKRPVDEDGNEIVPDPNKVTQGFVAAPVPFKAIITPRDEKRAVMVCQEWENAISEQLDRETMQWRNIPEGMRAAYSQEWA
ncbi:putative cytochrome P450 [Zopfia rhizophila CBS 207.26]|uniref:Putative cytochrome P450 n=1 Tax=Zopfia rhizophila CBS 207.26 TaxID=1314779 RepID=A0A6A6E3M3_9PEZI|nr:putative cytochrome P450 [Zopfia rhizophila CBS 207.26]